MAVRLRRMPDSLLGRFNSLRPHRLILGDAGYRGGRIWLRNVEYASQLGKGVECGTRRCDLSLLPFGRHIEDRDCVDGFLIDIIILLVLAGTPTKLLHDLGNWELAGQPLARSCTLIGGFTFALAAQALPYLL